MYYTVKKKLWQETVLKDLNLFNEIYISKERNLPLISKQRNAVYLFWNQG